MRTGKGARPTAKTKTQTWKPLAGAAHAAKGRKPAAQHAKRCVHTAAPPCRREKGGSACRQALADRCCTRQLAAGGPAAAGPAMWGTAEEAAGLEGLICQWSSVLLAPRVWASGRHLKIHRVASSCAGRWPARLPAPVKSGLLQAKLGAPASMPAGVGGRSGSGSGAGGAGLG